ncbi:MAG: hypothetical protein ACREOI_29070, partial [bacterium]
RHKHRRLWLPTPAVPVPVERSISERDGVAFGDHYLVYRCFFLSQKATKGNIFYNAILCLYRKYSRRAEQDKPGIISREQTVFSISLG